MKWIQSMKIIPNEFLPKNNTSKVCRKKERIRYTHGAPYNWQSIATDRSATDIYLMIKKEVENMLERKKERNSIEREMVCV